MQGTATLTFSGYMVGGDDRLYWNATTPTGTGVSFEVKVGSGSFTQVTNGGLISNLPLSGTVNLTIKATLTTTDVTVTPSISEIWLYNERCSKIIVLTISTLNITPAVGNAVVKYNGQGALAGRGGPAEAFNGTFTPDLVWKGNQADEEHISMNMRAYATVIPVTYYDTQTNEHISMNMSATATVIDIHDL